MEHSSDPIALVDLRAQYADIKPEIQQAFDGIFENFAFLNGPQVAEMENLFAQLHGLSSGHAIGCSNGTSALTVALRAFSLSPGAEVILPSHTFFATAESVILAGYKPVFADINPEDYTIDPAQVEALISPETEAIIPVHIYGNMANMDAIMTIAETHGLKVLEDAAQAQMAAWNGKMSGTYGDAGTYSFYPSKNLGAYGDAGLVMTRHDALGKVIRKLIDHGREDRYLHDMVGDNLRIDSLQAAFLTVKLKRLAAWTKQRRDIAQKYDDHFKPQGFKVIDLPPQSESARHLYIVEVENRDEVMAHLNASNIACMIHYPIPLHLQPALQGTAMRAGDLSVTERIAKRIVSIPMYPELSDAQINRVAQTLLDVARP